jgi:hypothetical protein
MAIYLGVMSDLSTQCLSRQKQADSLLEAGNHTLTNITASPSRPQQATANSNRNAAYSQQLQDMEMPRAY